MKKTKKTSLALALLLTMLFTSMAPGFVQAADNNDGIMPRDQIIKIMEKANDYWISTHPNPGRAFWDEGTYHTGNMEAYLMTGIEAYRNYSTKWAEKNQWMGAKGNDPSKWKYSYGEKDEFVLFGDWQNCFQTYIDLYNLEPDDKKVARAKQVMNYETNTTAEDYWWWIDGLYMVMPVMTRMYNLTGEQKYLDKLYVYYKNLKDKIYDKEEGLWYRDATYLYPKYKSPNGKKVFWARGNGWVVAAHARILQDLPTDDPHRVEYVETFKDMMNALVKTQQADGSWGRSMADPLQAPGPETSGTAFFVYGMAWGINSGVLDRDTYLPTLVKGWNYLANTALQPDGRVGYVQPVGGDPAPDKIINASSTANFGVGAFLLACAEMARLSGGMTGDIYPYLQKRMVGAVALKVDTPHIYAQGKISHIDENNHQIKTVTKDDRTLVPVRVISEKFGAIVDWDDSTQTVTVKDEKKKIDITMKLGSATYTVNGQKKALDVPADTIEGRTMVPLRAMVEALNKKVFWDDGLIVISEKEDVFYPSCEEGLITMLKQMLDNDKYPVRPAQPQKPFTVTAGDAVPTVPNDPAKIRPVKVTASSEPQPENPAVNSVDSKMDTRWSADGDCYIIYDLGSEQDVSKVGASFWKNNARTTKFELEYSSDAKNWQSFFKGTSTLGQTTDFKELGKKVRYIKLIGHGNTENTWTSVLEFDIYRTGASATTTPATTTVSDSSAGKLKIVSATASKEPEAANVAKNAFDGDLNTRWSADGEASLNLDLGSSKTVEKIGVAFWQNDVRQTKYDLSVSQDGKTWTKVFSGASTQGETYHYTVLSAPTQARYIKIDGHGNTINAWNSVLEVEVYGK